MWIFLGACASRRHGGVEGMPPAVVGLGAANQPTIKDGGAVSANQTSMISRAHSHHVAGFSQSGAGSTRADRPPSTRPRSPSSCLTRTTYDDGPVGSSG